MLIFSCFAKYFFLNYASYCSKRLVLSLILNIHNKGNAVEFIRQDKVRRDLLGKYEISSAIEIQVGKAENLVNRFKFENVSTRSLSRTFPVQDSRGRIAKARPPLWGRRGRQQQPVGRRAQGQPQEHRKRRGAARPDTWCKFPIFDGKVDVKFMVEIGT